MNEINDTTSLPGNEVPPRPETATGPAAPNHVPPTGYNNAVPPAQALQRRDGMLAGVAGGLAHYFNIDATVVRLLMVVVGLVTFPALPLAYLIAWMVMPKAEDASQTNGAASPPPPAPTMAG